MENTHLTLCPVVAATTNQPLRYSNTSLTTGYVLQPPLVTWSIAHTGVSHTNQDRAASADAIVLQDGHRAPGLFLARMSGGTRPQQNSHNEAAMWKEDANQLAKLCMRSGILANSVFLPHNSDQRLTSRQPENMTTCRQITATPAADLSLAKEKETGSRRRLATDYFWVVTA